MAIAMPASCTSGVPPKHDQPENCRRDPGQKPDQQPVDTCGLRGWSGVLFIARPELVLVLLASAGCLSLQSTEASLSIGKASSAVVRCLADSRARARDQSRARRKPPATAGSSTAAARPMSG